MVKLIHKIVPIVISIIAVVIFGIVLVASMFEKLNSDQRA
jgi:hypothetical protein